MKGEIRRMVVGLGAAGMVLVGACSSEQLYNGLQQNRAEECREMPGMTQERCLARYDESYRDYAERREQELDDPSF